MTTDRRARRARESERALTPPPTSTVPQTVEALRRGARLMWGNPHADCRSWATSLDYSGLPPDVCRAVGDLADNASRTAVVAAAEACERAAADDGLSYAVRERCGEAGERARLLAAFLGDYVSACTAMHQADLALAASVDDAERRMLLTTRAELSYVGHLILTGVYDASRDAARVKIRNSAWEDVKAEAELVTFWVGLDAKGAGPIRDDTGFDPRDEDHPLADGWFDEPPPEDGDGPETVTVLARIGEQSSASAAREAKAMLGRIEGTAIPLIAVPSDLRAIEAGLVAEAPHLAGLIREALSILTRRRSVGGPPIVAIGPPGSGKSRMMRRIGEGLGLPVTVYNADATSDSSFCGTPRRWSSMEIAVPTAAMATSGVANPAILIDELDKAGGATHGVGGRLYDGLHGLWSPETSRRWRDPVASAAMDLSHVVYLCTANGPGAIPRSLLDRARVLQAPLPGPEHLVALAPRVAVEAAASLGLHPAEATLDGDEVDLLALHWSGGSLRRLQRLVETVLAARAATAPRH
ncbi:AAA family ATPase [Methylorubrum thiocyanatum]|uniref:AAA family ATPase n=1 Tax=Methylorubrum thiocyanatum TaxID=47958 RepID=UPI0035C8209A